jgi:hypothetical protein
MERIAAGSGPSVTTRDFLGKIESGELSYIWEVRPLCLAQLRPWLEETFDLDRTVGGPEDQHWTVYQKIG